MTSSVRGVKKLVHIFSVCVQPFLKRDPALLHTRKDVSYRKDEKTLFLCCSDTMGTPNYILCLIHISNAVSQLL